MLVLLVGTAGAGRAQRMPAADPSGRATQRTISFSGLDWIVKDGTSPVGPGPNYFSAGPKSVWVDQRGRLHLTIRHAHGHWLCSEVFATQSLGYGTYVFTLKGPVDLIDPNAVLGLFTWSDDPDYNHREIDIEVSRWGYPQNQDTQYVVQPYDTAGNIHRFDMTLGDGASTQRFGWRTDRVDFTTAHSRKLHPPPASEIQKWSYSGPDVPVPGNEAPHINLWLFQGAPPTDGRDLEVMVESFRFIPAPTH